MRRNRWRRGGGRFLCRRVGWEGTAKEGVKEGGKKERERDERDEFDDEDEESTRRMMTITTKSESLTRLVPYINNTA